MSADPTAPSSRRARLARGLCLLSFLAFLALSLLAASARWFWLGEVATSFSWQLGFAGLAGAVTLFMVKRPRLALITLSIAALQLAPELCLYLPAPGSGPMERPRETPVMTLATCNLLITNPQQDEFLAWLDANDPDVIVFQEVALEWLEFLESLRERYPHQQLAPVLGSWGSETWGGALLSRIPFERSGVPDFEARPFEPPVEAVLRFAGRELTLRAVHAPRPGRPWRTDSRSAFLDELGAQSWDDSCVLAGDLNTTSSSPAFAALLRATGLRDSRQGFGRQPSFTTSALMPGLSVAIDHVLVGDALHVLDRRTSHVPGSDHRAVIVRLAFARR